MRPLLPVSILFAALVSACTWVPLEPEGAEVKVLAADAPTSHCEARGEITVSVRDRVALVQRNELKIRDELENLARNEAGRLAADTVQPLEEPAVGEQRFAAFRCKGARAPETSQSRPPVQSLQLEEAETFPVKLD